MTERRTHIIRCCLPGEEPCKRDFNTMLDQRIPNDYLGIEQFADDIRLADVVILTESRNSRLFALPGAVQPQGDLLKKRGYESKPSNLSLMQADLLASILTAWDSPRKRTIIVAMELDTDWNRVFTNHFFNGLTLLVDPVNTESHNLCEDILPCSRQLPSDDPISILAQSLPHAGSFLFCLYKGSRYSEALGEDAKHFTIPGPPPYFKAGIFSRTDKLDLLLLNVRVGNMAQNVIQNKCLEALSLSVPSTPMVTRHESNTSAPLEVAQITVDPMPCHIITGRKEPGTQQPYTATTNPETIPTISRIWVEQQLKKNGKDNPFVGESSALIEMYDAIHLAASNPKEHILVYGQTGAGKEVIYELLKRLADSNKPFHILQLAGLRGNELKSAVFGHVKGSYNGALKDRAGAVAAAEGGTLVLDNLQFEDMSFFVPLLRLMEPKQEYQPFGSDEIRNGDCRIIGGFNIDPMILVNNKQMPSDVFKRLTFHIDITPLDNRKDDIPILVREFVNEFVSERNANNKTPLTAEDVMPPSTLVDEWKTRSWNGVEGNVRGLRGAARKYAMERAASLNWNKETQTNKQAQPKSIRNVGRQKGSSDITEEHLVQALTNTLAASKPSWSILLKQINALVSCDKQKDYKDPGALVRRIQRMKTPQLLNNLPITTHIAANDLARICKAVEKIRNKMPHLQTDCPVTDKDPLVQQRAITKIVNTLFETTR